MDYKELTQQQKELLSKPLPAEAVTQHPTKKFLSSIKSIYVTERLNEVFGIGKWMIEAEVVENHDKMIVVKVRFSIPEYGIKYECYGGNDNADRGDAYKGASTDALTKIGSWLGIGADVFKGLHGKTQPTQTQPTRKEITSAHLDNEETCTKLLNWAYAAKNAHPDKPFDAGEYLAKHYDVAPEVKNRFTTLFNIHKK